MTVMMTVAMVLITLLVVAALSVAIDAVSAALSGEDNVVNEQELTSEEIDKMLRFLAKLDGKEITILPPVLVGERPNEEHDVQDGEGLGEVEPDV